MRNRNADPQFHLYAAACMFFLGLYNEAKEEAMRGPSTRLQNRLLFHIVRKLHQQCSSAADMLHLSLGLRLGFLSQPTRDLQFVACSSSSCTMLHCQANKLKDETGLLQHHQNLTPAVEDQLSLAAMNCYRSHIQDAVEIYRKHLVDLRDCLAISSKLLFFIAAAARTNLVQTD